MTRLLQIDEIEPLLDESQRYRIENVWASSRALKKNRPDNNVNDDDCDNNVCVLCKEMLNVDKVECSVCLISVHVECLETFKSEWETNDLGEAVCKQCHSISRLAS